ncbi:putative F-box domain, leucine-rich repeat domain superfamily, F-box-like domain superfamily [Helianthus annuus]|nr:putative F-box domain, leucine-rich repeat domain superfamily, F-box-like domain superfamily [Helianthus annuus]
MMDFTTNNERRQVSVEEEEENGMGKLPEHVMDSILERLPLQDIIRTSILSKKWRYKWTTMKAVVFDEQISNKLAENGAFGRHGFTRVINQVLLLHKGSSISKFYLYIPNMFLDSFQEVDQWIFFLSTKGVEDLTIANSIQLYQLPSCLFSCLELRKLELGKCIFKPPLQFEGFPYLESLTLNNIDFTTTDVVINLPHLTKLILQYCTNVYNLKIKATKLLNLVVVGCPDVMFLELLHSQRVGFLCTLLQKPVKDFVRLERMNLALMFTKMPYLVRLFIDGHFLKESELMHHGVEATSNHLESPNCLDQTLNRLRTVELSPVQGSKPELLFIKPLLAHSPSLEKFTIQSDGTLDANKRFNIAKDVMQPHRKQN